MPATDSATDATVPEIFDRLASKGQVAPLRRTSGAYEFDSDRGGNVSASPSEAEGLFAWDTRFLSRWVLKVDGLVPNVLSTDDLNYFEVQFFQVPGTGTIYVDSDLSIMRKRSVGNGFSEDIAITNESPNAAHLLVELEAGADFRSEE